MVYSYVSPFFILSQEGIIMLIPQPMKDIIGNLKTSIYIVSSWFYLEELKFYAVETECIFVLI